MNVCLCMMVKNESKVIERALSSVATEIDGWCITDTGSTDLTPAIIEEFFRAKGIPGEIHHTLFKDFGTSRTETIANARRYASSRGIEYLLLLDADEVVEVRDQSWKSQLAGAGYLIRYDDALSYRVLYLVPASTEWKFIGRTHEYLSEFGETTVRQNFDGIVLHDYGDGGSKADKFTRDIALLSLTLEEDPANERAVFYLAESFRNGNIDLSRAAELYLQRSTMGGFEEEAWFAAYRYAQCIEQLTAEGGDPWPIVVAYLKAWERRPWRAEPLTELVRYAATARIHLLGAVIGEYAIAHVIPNEKRRNDILFIETRKHGSLLYDWLSVCHYWCGYFQRSKVLAELALQSAEIGDHARIQQNIQLAASHKKVAPGDPRVLVEAVARLRASSLNVSANLIAEAARPLFPAGSPASLTLDFEQSICGFYSTRYKAKASELSEKLLLRRDIPDEMRVVLMNNRRFHVKALDDGVLCSIRLDGFDLPVGLNGMNPSLCRVGAGIVVLIRAVNYRIDSNGSYLHPGFVETRSFIADLTPGLEARNLRELTSSQPMDDGNLMIRGFEDCRLFSVGEPARVWGVANRAHPVNLRGRAMYLLEIDDVMDEHPSILRAVHLQGPAENRTEKNWMPVDGDRLFRLVYSVDPTVVLEPSPADGTCNTVSLRVPPWSLAEMRGGSQLASLPGGGYIAFVHGVLTERPRRSYFHRIVLFDKDLAVSAVSRSFVLRRQAIEFVSACIVDGDDLIIAWGDDDAEAWLGRMKIADAVALCDVAVPDR